MARALGYRVDGPSAATTTVQFTLAQVQGDDYTIPAGTEVFGTYLGQTVRFQTLEAHVISAGSLTNAAGVSARQQTSGTETLAASNNGEPYQKYVLGSTSILHNKTQKTLVVTVDGETWAEVDSFANSVSTDKHYTVIRDHLDRLTVLFGDSIQGRTPYNSTAIAATYKTGGGVSGNVPLGTLTTLTTTLAEVASITNSAPGVGGGVRQTNDSIKLNAPAFFAAQDRAVSGVDFNAILSSISGIVRAQGFRTGLAVVECRIVPLGWTGGAMADNNAIVQNAITTIAAKRMLTDNVAVYTAVPAHPSISIHVRVKDGHNRDTVRVAVISSLETLYALSANQFGDSSQTTDLYFSDMVAAVDGTVGVNSVDVLLFTRKPLLLGTGTNGWDFAADNATLGTVGVSENAVDETWTIKFYDTNKFKVQGEVSGYQGEGTVGAVFTSTNARISFTVTAGALGAMKAGNEGRFKTSKPVGNIPVGEKEHPVFVSTAAPAGDLTITLEGGIVG